jgi:UDP-2,4-diacetamido-2,4,6-trideoxy-beta-L-altropyranose hydrolase
MKNLAIRVDGNSEIGLGHVVRCISVTRSIESAYTFTFYLKETDSFVLDFLQKNGCPYKIIPKHVLPSQDAAYFLSIINPNDMVLLDSYELKSNWQKEIKEKNHQLIVIDDLMAWEHYADHIINHNGGIEASAYKCASYTRRHCGFEYRMIRPEFIFTDSIRKRSIQSLNSVVISFGSSDPQEISLPVVRFCLKYKNLQKIIVLTSPLNKNIHELARIARQHPDIIEIKLSLSAIEVRDLLLHADLLLCSPSTISLEACGIGTPLVLYTTASNQEENAKALVEMGCAIGIGGNDHFEWEILAHLLDDENSFIFEANRMLSAQANYFREENYHLPEIFLIENHESNKNNTK